jgi:hypothetical protein
VVADAVLTGPGIYLLEFRLNDHLCHTWPKKNHFVLLGAVVAGDEARAGEVGLKVVKLKILMS